MSNLLKYDIDSIKESLIRSLAYIDYIKTQNIQLHIDANDATFIANSRYFSLEDLIHQSLTIPVFDNEIQK